MSSYDCLAYRRQEARTEHLQMPAAHVRGRDGPVALRLQQHKRQDGQSSSATATAYLVAHVQQGAQGQAEGEALVVTHKVAHILQKEVTWAVQVTEAQIGHDLHANASFAPLALVESSTRSSSSSRCNSTSHQCSQV